MDDMSYDLSEMSTDALRTERREQAELLDELGVHTDIAADRGDHVSDQESEILSGFELLAAIDDELTRR